MVFGLIELITGLWNSGKGKKRWADDIIQHAGPSWTKKSQR